MNDGETLISKAIRTRPMVMLSKRQLREKIEDAIGVLKDANTPEPTIFRRESVLVRLVSNGLAPVLEALDPDSLMGELASNADWFKLNAKGEEVAADPPVNVARVLLKSREAVFPIIEGICEAPFFSRNGKLIATPGYHSVELAYLAPLGFEPPMIPEHPGAAEVRHARTLLLEELLYDFPFADDASRAHAVALLILPFARRMIDGSTPIHAIDAPTEGTGKGLLATVCVVPALGRELESMSEVRDEEERRKRITSLLLAGRPYGFFDNINGRVEGSSLASALTARTWADRVLGQSKMVRLPVNLTWLVTGNSLRFSGELARRTVYIRLDAKVERPYLRDGFKHPLPSWAIEHRAELVWAALIMIQNWIAYGRPAGKATLGSFEDWARTIGGILEAGGISGFLANQTNFYEQAGAETELWSAFVE
jgi:putative DNA primase/helicase